MVRELEHLSHHIDTQTHNVYTHTHIHTHTHTHTHTHKHTHTQGMGDMLSSALESSPPELKSQLHYIITQLHSETPSAGATDNSETSLSDDSADEDEEEEEDEEADDVIEGDEDEVAIATTGPVGESLLVQYLITPEVYMYMLGYPSYPHRVCVCV